LTFKDHLTTTKKRLTDATDRLTGAKIENELAQYSDVYGEILLGMHRDMERHQAVITQHDSDMRQGLSHLKQLEVNIAKRFTELNQAVTQAEEHTKGAYRFSEEAKSAAVVAGGIVKEAKEEQEKNKEFLTEVQKKWQELMPMIENQRDEIHTLSLAFKRFRSLLIWSIATIVLLVVIGGLAWKLHFFG
jgi:CHASE3 domain sensor protein